MLRTAHFMVVMLLALAGSLTIGTTVHAQEKNVVPVKICVSKNAEPTNRCMEATKFSLRKVPAGNRHRRAPAHFDLIMQGLYQDVEVIEWFTSAATTADEVEICIINGANICPPEPFEIVWVCITTGMLAGSECPHPPDASSEPVVTLKLETFGRQ